MNRRSVWRASLAFWPHWPSWGVSAPRRRLEIPRLLRWSNNLGIVALDTLLVGLAFPVAAVGLAVIARDNGWYILNRTDLPGWIVIIVAILAFDLTIYLQHVLFHAVPAL